LATSEVASERIEEVSTPSRLTFVEMIKAGIFTLYVYKSFSLFLVSLFAIIVVAANKIEKGKLTKLQCILAFLYPPFINGKGNASYQTALYLSGCIPL
jgi:hypothetical protein